MELNGLATSLFFTFLSKVAFIGSNELDIFKSPLRRMIRTRKTIGIIIQGLLDQISFLLSIFVLIRDILKTANKELYFMLQFF